LLTWMTGRKMSCTVVLRYSNFKKVGCRFSPIKAVFSGVVNIVFSFDLAQVALTAGMVVTSCAGTQMGDGWNETATGTLLLFLITVLRMRIWNPVPF
jgi:hypothetical protein